MNSKTLNTVQYVGATLLIMGTVTFLLSIMGLGDRTLTMIGVGLVMGSVFIFMMGLFLSLSEELTVRYKKENRRFNQ
ncbi:MULTISPECIES: hypothetical protein [Salimicrobium]|uniref:Uncharacterized protein n=4 Tax=Salimicrobium TaxID=351195 RepID=K2GBG0_9BACI|nr:MULTISPECIES: hypothetical protein [Salimicrobium]AKG04944.1 hypothetical protein AAV35_009115 [Salimicrobium jeotgali]EKE31622.1 hypothetical protein MJ3_07573 [Salimicrobium jeotgali]MBM7696443.1 putative membrane channel-forming protein YqfA (hemolysin III family) [Salimicrobium jeotgali]PBB06145.1 hypothetical protein CKW00_05160 [Salimicrobium humidisoli]SDX44520.1 hypothetical protein SAMN04488081_0541 [Salimicrobium album]